MTSFGLFGGSGLFALPVLIAQWVGVVALAKSGRSGAWWCMTIGTVLTTLGTLAGLSIMVMAMVRPSWLSGSSAPFSTFMAASLGMMGASLLGSLLFSIGFALHALKVSRLSQRTAELETLCAAMAEEMGGKGGAAS